MRLINLLSQVYIIANLASCEEATSTRCVVDVSLADVTGKPIEGAQVSARYPVGISVNPGGGFPTDRHKTTRALTDLKGKAMLSYQTASSPDGLIWIRKEGFYESVYRSPDWKSSADKSWHTDIIEILKPIKNPIPMIARKDIRIRTPKFNVTYGFDLEMGESLPPLGNGKNADIEFILTGSRKDLGAEDKEHIDFKMIIRCPNPDDGFVEFLIADSLEFGKGSVLPSGHESPETGYTNSLIRHYRNDNNGGMVESHRIRQEDRNKSAYFRIRTKKDQSGKITSAHYGKIYGPLEIRPAYKQYGHYDGTGQGGFFIQYTYFNLTPNDRNVEFDPNQNLLPSGNVTRP